MVILNCLYVRYRNTKKLATPLLKSNASTLDADQSAKVIDATDTLPPIPTEEREAGISYILTKTVCGKCVKRMTCCALNKVEIDDVLAVA